MWFHSQLSLELVTALSGAVTRAAGVLGEAVQVPEPSVALALILGSAGMLWILRRRN